MSPSQLTIISYKIHINTLRYILLVGVTEPGHTRRPVIADHIKLIIGAQKVSLSFERIATVALLVSLVALFCMWRYSLFNGENSFTIMSNLQLSTR